MLWTIIIFLLILSVLVIFHELGHFLLARKFQVKVLEFGLGFPPRAKKLFTDKHGTLFSLNWLPIGGFVAMAGEDEPGSSSPAPIDPSASAVTSSSSKIINSDTEFYKKPAYQRLLIICAGPFFSLLLGIICFTFLYSVKGIPRDFDQARIISVAPDSPAAQAGIIPNTGVYALISDPNMPDAVLSRPTTQQVIDFASHHRGQTILLEGQACQPDSNICAPEISRYQVYIRSAEETPAGEGAMGIAFQEQFITHYPWWQMPFLAAAEGIRQSLWLTWQILLSLGQILTNLFSGRPLGGDVAGPVGIVSTVRKEGLFDQGIWFIVGFAGMLSINLAVMNMLPIPAVDGGRALLIILEKFFSRKRIAKIEGTLNAAGFMALILLMIIITFNDIVKIVRGG